MDIKILFCLAFLGLGVWVQGRQEITTVPIGKFVSYGHFSYTTRDCIASQNSK